MRKASIEDKELVTDILVSAFAPLKGDNSINLIVKQDHKRVQRMRILMAYLFEKAFYFGEVFISSNNKACLLLHFPHKEKTTLRTILLNIRLAFFCIGIERVFEVLKRQRIAKQFYPKERHIRPVILAVKEDAKGNGTAARLMLHVKDQYKDNQLPVIIDTSSEYNVKLYKRFGFKLIKKEKGLKFPIYFLRLN
ncbi:GNAT family N-acetyltransferase [Aquimarina hainanensis]|uniref:GNAT family N-acetyltransferase n=1 Tax=Aquimarina hainanensis TaxID=1578017 RepID=A0ABW5N6N8_9FLAO|nr:GNAT family N-acetyltransferase [Aquimarina sp. TRL1]QKX05557.1 GNAT family N-acetyltransferase [Aquimarina sp. TRL1]